MAGRVELLDERTTHTMGRVNSIRFKRDAASELEARKLMDALRTTSPASDAITRDFYAEGIEAAISNRSDMAPADVVEFGLDAEAEWNDGYNRAKDIEEWGNDEPDN